MVLLLQSVSYRARFCSCQSNIQADLSIARSGTKQKRTCLCIDAKSSGTAALHNASCQAVLDPCDRFCTNIALLSCKLCKQLNCTFVMSFLPQVNLAILCHIHASTACMSLNAAMRCVQAAQITFKNCCITTPSLARLPRLG